MAQSVDVGSVLGGRYKVTARVLATAEQDVVLDGIDQVLNRPVSILVAGPDNGDHLSQGAREVATGERQANLQILDLGTSDGTTYLISNKSSAAELLDLVVPTAPFEEPFFTDTLGNEIFGMPRPELPADSEDYDYVYEDQPKASGPAAQRNTGAVSGDRNSGPAEPAVPQTTSKKASKPPVPPSIVPPAAAVRNPDPAPKSAPKDQAAPQSSSATDEAPTPKVTLWSDDDYGFINERHDQQGQHGRGATAAALAAGPAAASGRKAANFPASARAASIGFDDDNGADDAFEDDDEENNPKTGGRWLVGAVVAVLIVAALIFAVSNISTLFGPSPVAGPASTSSSAPAPQPSNTAAASKPATSAASSAPPTATVAPAIASVTRLVPDAPNMGSQYDGKLPTTVDGNPGTFWQTLEYSNDSFAGLTSSINLVVKLVAPADIKTVTISQLGGSGGSFRLLTNDQPTLDGAKEIGTGSFTSPDITLTAPQGTKAQYVIISFTQLPKQQSYQTYPYAVKIAGIGIK